jgi:hypothetical protein
MQAYHTNHRPVSAFRRYATSRVAIIFLAAMCFAQIAPTQHIHALDDIDQSCLICRFSDTQDIPISSSVEPDPHFRFYEQQTEQGDLVRVGVSFGYEARAPPISSND